MSEVDEIDEREVQVPTDTDLAFAVLVQRTFGHADLTNMEALALSVAARKSSRRPPIYNARPNIRRCGSDESEAGR